MLGLYKSKNILWIKLPEDVSPSFLRSIPGSSWDGTMKMFAVTEQHLMRLVTLLVTSEDLKPYWPADIKPEDFLAEVEALSKSVREAESLRSGNGELPADVPVWLNHMGTSPRLYQYHAAQFLITAKRAILALGLGAGKSMSVITALKILNKDRALCLSPAVVICPASIKKLTWETEIKKFSTLRTCVIEGSPELRRHLYNQSADVFVINPELAVKDLPKMLELLSPGRSSLIVDEATMAKSGESRIHKSLQALSDKAGYFWMLTGTPLMNNLMELYHLTTLVDKSLFRSQADFKYRYIPRQGTTWIMHGAKNLTELTQIISPVIYTRTPVELKDEMPSTVSTAHPIELTEDQRVLYNHTLRDTREDLENIPYRAVTKYTLSHVLANIIRMKQICNDVGLVGEESSLGAPKTARLISLMSKELMLDKVIIFTQFAKWVNTLQLELQRAGIASTTLHGSLKEYARSANIHKFKTDPECSGLILTTAGGMGLNLQEASAVVFMDMLWNPQMMKQIAGRAIRLSSRHKSVSLVHIFAKDTIEEYILNSLKNKSKLFDAVMHNETLDDDSYADLYSELMEMLK